MALALVACRGKVLATASLPGAGKTTTTFVPSSKGVVVWADTDAKWFGPDRSNPDFTYDIEAARDGKSIAKFVCSTKGVTVSMCGVNSTFGDRHDADCELKLPCAVPNLGPGEVELTVTGKVGPNVLSVKKMSLNLREP